MSGELSFRIKAEKAIRALHFKYWKPENEAEFIDIEITIGDHAFKTRGKAGLNEFSTECQLAAGDHFQVSIRAFPTFVPSQDDLRDLSVILDSIDFAAN